MNSWRCNVHRPLLHLIWTCFRELNYSLETTLRSRILPESINCRAGKVNFCQEELMLMSILVLDYNKQHWNFNSVIHIHGNSIKNRLQESDFTTLFLRLWINYSSCTDAFKDRVLLSDIRNVNCCLNTCLHLNKSTLAFPPVRENRIQLYKVFILTIEPQFLILMFTPC